MQSDFSVAFEKVKELVRIFERNYSYYKDPKYQEAEVRKDFIDPFLTALGWDVNHEVQRNPYKQEVKVEKSQRQAGEKGKKFADYAFYLSPNFKDPVFYVEAKKPAILLKDNTQYYLQTHKYGWNSQTPLAILTDFEELIVLDCRTKPHPKFSANVAVRVYRYENYVDENVFGEIYYLFSREAVEDNSLIHFVETQIPKRKFRERQLKMFGGGYKTVDNDFLEYIDQLRFDLAKAFFNKNPELTAEQLTEATQKTIDRLVFVRFLEDKQIEVENFIDDLKDWKSFIQLSSELNGKYNGIVFKQSIIDKPEFLGIENDLFLDICHDISSKESPYNFNVIPIHILGSIYERFLGKVVNIEDGKIKIQFKPEVRKAGGVYYTPQYIVDHIVSNSVGKLVDGKTPVEIDKLSFADISCGSGSFLIGVYDYLIDYHKNYYQIKLQNKTEIDRRSEDFGNVLFNEGIWMLTLKRKQDILLNCIYGVDIDNQAVEVSQLSLFLKLLEDENFGTTARNHQITVFSKVLPDLTNNICSGNSLVGWDVVDKCSMSIAEQKEVNPFSYQAAFPSIVSQGGFDVILGNPPYVKEYTNRQVFEVVKKSYLEKYYQGKMDLWYFFLCNGLDLLKTNGLLGFIVPNNWTTNAGASIMRNKVVIETQIQEIVDFGSYMVFDSASIQTMILLIKKYDGGKSYSLDYSKLLNDNNSYELALGLITGDEHPNYYRLKPQFIRERNLDSYILFGDKRVNQVLDKIAKASNFKLDEKDEVAQGIVAPQDSVNKKSSAVLKLPVGTGVFILSDSEVNKLKLSPNERELLKPLYTSMQVRKYLTLKNNDHWIIYTDSSFRRKDSMKSFPVLKKHLDKFQKIITSSNKPYGLHRARKERFFMGEKIISLRKCSEEPIFSYAAFDSYLTQTYYVIKSERISLKYLLGILNSKLVKFWLLHRGKMQGSNYQIDKEPLVNIPIRLTSNLDEKIRLIGLVDTLMATQEVELTASTSSDEEFFKRKIGNLMNQIDNVVYKIYNLSSEDISLIDKV